MRRLLPKAWRKSLVRWTRRPLVGSLNWGDLRRLDPVSRAWGGDRGLPIDRFYIEDFLQRHSRCMRGTVLEIGDDVYARRFGGPSIDKVEVLSSERGKGTATWVADLAEAPEIPSGRFDCIILTQTLQFIADSRAVVDTLHRVLAPGGDLLLTVPGISQTTPADARRWTDYWRFTPASVRWLLEARFATEEVTVRGAGNVLASAAFLFGLATDELTAEELGHRDEHYPLVVTAHARKGKRSSK